MAELSHFEQRPKLQVLSGDGEKRSAKRNSSSPVPGVSQGSRQSFRVLETEWTFVGRAKDYPVQQPKITVLAADQIHQGRVRRPLYVLRAEAEKFIILDMNTGGYYEYRVAGGDLYIRRLMMRAI